MKKILIYVALLLCCSCDMNNQKLQIVNQTQDTIYYNLMLDNKLEKDLFLYKIAPFDTVFPNFVMGSGAGVWEYKINNKSKDSILYINIFKNNIVTDSVINYNIYKQLRFKVKDLDSLKWKVVLNSPIAL